MKKPLVSVVIPVFNGAQHLQAAVESVQKSTYKNFEVLLIDDGSTDTSRAICHSLEKKYRNVRFYQFAKNRGLGRVLNYALHKAHGEYICRLNQDDIMLPHRIKTQVDYLAKHTDVVVVGSWIALFDTNGNEDIIRFLKNDENIKKTWYIVGPFADPSVMYRKDVATRVGGYWQDMWPADDTHLWYRMGMAGKLANIQKPLVKVRWHKEAASVKHWKRLVQSTYKMHRWTHWNIGQASSSVQLYWTVQYIAGMSMSPEFNWGVYRIMKKLFQLGSSLRDFLRTIQKRGTVIVAKVAIQPAMLNRSGQ